MHHKIEVVKKRSYFVIENSCNTIAKTLQRQKRQWQKIIARLASSVVHTQKNRKKQIDYIEKILS